MTIYSFTHTEKDLGIFYQERASRTLKYLNLAKYMFESERDWLEETTTLKHNGLLKITEFFPREKILSIGRKVDDLVKKRQGLNKIRNHAAESTEDIQNGRFAYYNLDEMREPSFSLRDKVSSVGIAEPLMQLPELAEVVFYERLLSIVTAYFQVIPVISFLKLRSTFMNNLPVVDTQFLHFDFGSYKILKAIIYLNDVELEGGPFCYIKGSHINKFDGWNKKSRFSDEEMHKVYGKDCITYCTAKAGDVFLAETTGLHRGFKPISADRNTLIVTFCVHPEYGFEYEPNQISGQSYDKLSDLGKASADALKINNL
jgi:hypothetical protein